MFWTAGALGLGLCWHLAGTWSIFTDYVNDMQMAVCTRSLGFVLFSSLLSLLLCQGRQCLCDASHRGTENESLGPLCSALDVKVEQCPGQGSERGERTLGNRCQSCSRSRGLTRCGDSFLEPGLPWEYRFILFS